MTYTLDEPFNDPEGRWDEYAPWDAAINFDAVDGFLTTQQHADIRSFNNYTHVVAVPQNPDLDDEQQSVMDADLQTSLETKAGAPLAQENWLMPTTTGSTGTITVGKIAARGGWSGLQFSTNGSALNVVLTSAVTPGIDISFANNISLIFPDYNTFDGTSTIQFTSDPHGVFGNGFDSAAVTFSSNTSVMPQLLLPVASFAHSGFNNTSITGVKITLAKASAPASGQTVTLMALRAVVSAWTESALDFDTRMGTVKVPVTLTGNIYAGTVAKNFQFVRGNGGKDDPIPSDFAMNMYFYPGGETSPNDAHGSTFNYIAFILREKKNLSGGTGSHIEAGLSFNDSSTTFTSFFVDQTGTKTGLHTVTIGGALASNQHFLFRVEIRGTQLVVKIYETDINLAVSSLYWQTTITDAAYVHRYGRVGFIGGLVSRDAYIDQIEVAPTAYAELQSEVFNSRTPVDGVRLAAVYAPDLNLFTNASAPDLLIDQTKTLSGSGSYRTAIGLTTNSFEVDDFTQMYLDIAIWVSSALTTSNKPGIFLNTTSGPEMFPVPNLQPAQWNVLHFDMGLFSNFITGTSYSLSVLAAANPDKPLGNFWVDSINVGRRQVAWYARASSTAVYQDFKGLVNTPTGALHFVKYQRGTQLQIKAVALTNTAWVSNFRAFPRYAELGAPVYSPDFATR